MNLADQLRDAPVPRPEPLARAVARRIDGRLAMFGWGLVYYAFLANYAVLGAGYGLIQLGTYAFGEPMPWWYTLLGLVAMIAVIWLSFWPFRWWKRRRLAPSLVLGRTGVLLDGEVAAWRKGYRGLSHVVIWFQHDGHEHALQSVMSAGMTPADHPVGTPVPVLYAPASKWALFFKSTGKHDGLGVAARVLKKPA